MTTTEADPLARFGAATRAWFEATFPEPTPAQRGAWAATGAGGSVLVSAPTGSGKTLAAFLAALDRLVEGPSRPPGTTVLYVSPLKALAYDVDRNLRAPLAGISRAAERLGVPAATVDVGMRTGDTSAEERRRLARTPPDVLITTPESLFLVLTSRAREGLAGIETVIVDEVHAVAGTKRGAHLALSLERLEALRRAADPGAAPLQRVGLSATQRPLGEVARFLAGGLAGGTVRDGEAARATADSGGPGAGDGGGSDRIRGSGGIGTSDGLAASEEDDGSSASGGSVESAAPEWSWESRPMTVVDANEPPHLDVEIVVPVEDMSRLVEPAAEPVSGPASGQVVAPPEGETGGTVAGGERRTSIWPAVHPRILDLVRAHRSTIVFSNSRRLAERICASLNELDAERRVAEAEAAGDAVPEDLPPVARAHHGSVAREQRTQIEEQLKAGTLPCVVATSSLELGIDMGAVDLVVQVESPGSVASGLQRIGRAGHQVGEPSVGKVFPKYRGDLLEAAVVTQRMREGEIEHTRYLRNALDVLAQQIVAMTALERWPVDRLLEVVRGAAGYADLTRSQLDGVLDMLAGRYPSDEFAELRPRITWDRVGDEIEGRSGAQRLAVTNAGTIPDRGLYGVYLVSGQEGGPGRGGRRVGELDEEMVYETRPGETFTLGSTTWRIEDITRDQVLVAPAPGEPGKLPFWHGDGIGRPIEVGRALGAFLREHGEAEPERSAERLQSGYGLDERAAGNLAAYLDEQRAATGAVPSDRQLVIERFRDEIGDWRVCVLSPFGGRVHAPWALAISARIRETLGVEVQSIHADDGIVLRLPDTAPWEPLGWGAAGDDPFDAHSPGPAGSGASPGTGASADETSRRLAEAVLIEPDEVEDLVVGELADSALFASRFRECAARSLLLPRRVGGGDGIRRTPLWQQRQRASDLLTVASKYGQFPVLLETYREVLSDVFDVPALVELLRAIARREVRVAHVETDRASPFASSLLFDYVASYLYEGDAPLAERRAQALSLDRELLAELLGNEELRDLIDADALAAVEAATQRLEPPEGEADRRARSADELHDLLREIGDLRVDEVAARARATEDEVATWLARLERERRAYRLRIAGDERWAAAEDAARFRDGLGAPPVAGLPDAFLEPVAEPLVDLVARYARTHGPFRTSDVADRLGLPPDAAAMALSRLEQEGRVVQGEFRPDGASREWCDAQVLRRLRRRSLAVLRQEVEAVEPEALARFLPGWQGVGSQARGVDRVFEVVEQLQRLPLPASVLERDVLAARVRDYQPGWLDELCASGEVVWVGHGALGQSDGLVALYLRDQAPLLAPVPVDPRAAVRGDPPGEPPDWWTDRHAALLDRLTGRGPAFWPELFAVAGTRGAVGDEERAVLDALWDLVWAGLVTNDAVTPLRALVGGGTAPRRRASGGSRASRRRAPRSLQRSGPPSVTGRWAAVADLTVPLHPDARGVVDPDGSGDPGGAGHPGGAGRPNRAGHPDAPAAANGSSGGGDTRAAAGTERASALAAQLLDRHGVLTRASVAGEQLPGGFSAVYPVLTAMEDAGRARRGYFIEGLGGAQFALPGAVDRLRACREPREEDDGPVVLAATDPANPYGGAFTWPSPRATGGQTARRVAGAYVVLRGGRLVAYLERGGRSLLSFSDDPEDLRVAAEGVATIARSGRIDAVRLQRIDGREPDGHELVDLLRSAGFTDHPRGLVLRG
ncbi:DEAD/DEAH box helicase [Egibacter rhizosphaerae]|uniref:Lhr family helicase n=1 Tax=Egibacter rhizosphaerae TaxID=1670831 RepID=UPI00197ABFE8|nr:DEAD/DEAH box helicase [Egibacter rhizosphaerae]